MKLVRLLIALAAATVLLGALASAGSARNFSFSSQSFRATFPAFALAGGFGTTDCPLTLEGSLHARTLVKTAGALIGYITGASVGTCRTGRGRVLTATLPWHVMYASFAGTLPFITTFNMSIRGFSYEYTEPVFGITCLFSGGLLTMALSLARGSVQSASLGGGTSSNCGHEPDARGTSSSFTSVTLTLI